MVSSRSPAVGSCRVSTVQPCPTWRVRRSASSSPESWRAARGTARVFLFVSWQMVNFIFCFTSYSFLILRPVPHPGQPPGGGGQYPQLRPVAGLHGRQLQQGELAVEHGAGVKIGHEQLVVPGVLLPGHGVGAVKAHDVKVRGKEIQDVRMAVIGEHDVAVPHCRGAQAVVEPDVSR